MSRVENVNRIPLKQRQEQELVDVIAVPGEGSDPYKFSVTLE